MSLKIYLNPDGQGEVSEDSSFLNPVKWQVTAAGSYYKTIYLRMEEPSIEFCENGQISVVDTSGLGQDSWYKFAAMDIHGLPGNYAAGPLNFEVGLNEELPISIMLTLPASTNIVRNHKLSVTYTRQEIPEGIE